MLVAQSFTTVSKHQDTTDDRYIQNITIICGLICNYHIAGKIDSHYYIWWFTFKIHITNIDKL